MDATPDLGWDQSWGFADPATAAAKGFDVVSGYLSNDPSKNLNAADVRAYHAHGIAVMLNWESDAGRPLLGGPAGRTDAFAAVSQARALIAAVGTAPHNRVVLYFSCDRDVSASNFPVVDAYYQAAAAICHAAGFGVGVYGEADLVAHLSASRITDAEWQTYAWSGGRVDPAADFYQYQNGQKLGGADVDFDRVIHAGELGAWWPDAHPLNSPNATEDDVPLNPKDPVIVAIEKKLDNLTRITTLLMHGDPSHPNSQDATGALIRAALTAQGAKIDTAAVAQALAPAVIAALGDKAGITEADVEQAVANVVNGAHIQVTP